MSHQRPIAAFLLLLCGCTPLAGHNRTAVKEEACKQVWRISFPEVLLEPNERIWGVELKVTTGRVLALNRILADWSMTVDPGYGESSFISGHAIHGVGCLLSADELGGFATVCDASSMPERGELPFAVEGTLVTTTDFETTRNRTFTMGELILREALLTTPLQTDGGDRDGTAWIDASHLPRRG
jgi:hypothetical protein